MSDKKYSVFVSSTFEDLKEERNAVLRAILQSGHFPLGMELWGAADEQQWQIIQRQIDVADYYIVIIAHRYGTEKDGISWTEREYDYATVKEVPVLGFVIADDVSWRPEFVDKGDAAERLAAFKNKVRSKPVSPWKNADALRTEVVLALNRQIQATPRIGWVRADEAVSPITANEIARLSEENAKLRAENESLTLKRLPDVGFEVSRASLYSRPDGSGKQRQFRFEAYIDSTLRHGVPVGITQKNCSVSFHGLSSELVIDQAQFHSGNGRSLQDLTIGGPTAFQINQETNYQSWTENDFPQKIEVVITLHPTGYEMDYTIRLTLMTTGPNDSTGEITWSK